MPDTELKPIETAPRNKYILLFGDSGYQGIWLRCAAGRWNSDKKRWETHSGDAFTDGGPEPLFWLPFPSAYVTEERKCKGCTFDWGHGYCGDCGGRGYQAERRHVSKYIEEQKES